MTPARWVLLATVAGVVAGLAVATLVVATWDPEPETITGEEAAQAFVQAWDRSKRGTFTVVSDFRRTTPNGELETTHQLSQSPPDVVRRQFGAIDGQLGGHPIVCTRDPRDEVSCVQGATDLAPWDEQVRAEVDRWAGYLTGDVPLYRVETAGDGCFDLRLARVFPSPPYGRRARFCFDEATGAPTYSEIRRDEGTDVLEATQVRSTVSAADFALPR